MLKSLIFIVFLIFVSCTGDKGKDALQQITVLTDATAENCPTGGTTVLAGIDNDSNGQLDENEITSRQHICNGSEPLTIVTAVDPGEDCEFGGSLIQTGLDDNQNGQLDEDEVSSSQYVCNNPVLTSITDEPLCFPGGKKISTGYDENNNDILEETEITSESYIDCTYLRNTFLSGSEMNESNIIVTTDATGNIIISGTTDGTMDGTPFGMSDAFVQKFDHTGTLLWTSQFGSSQSEEVKGIATDSAGSIFITGNTNGALSGNNIGDYDAFLRKYDSDGNELWTRQFGSTLRERAASVATDSVGNSIVVGHTKGNLAGSLGNDDFYIRKYDPDGLELWTRQYGTAGFEYAAMVTVTEDDSILLAGTTTGNLVGITSGGLDIVVVKYSSTGDVLWVIQDGAGGDDEVKTIVSLPDGRILLAGTTESGFLKPNQGGYDVFAVILTAEGMFVKGIQDGTTGDDDVLSAAVTDDGKILLAGTAGNNLYGPTYENYRNAFLLVTDPSLYIYKSLQMPSTGDVTSISVATGINNTLILAGTVDASEIEGLSTQGSDVFISIMEKH